MDKKLAFKWVSFIGDSEEFVGRYADSKLVVNFIPTKVNLAKMIETAKYVEELEGVKVSLGQYYSHVFIDGLTTSIQLVDSFDVGDHLNLYTVSDSGPTARWLLDNKEALSTADPSRVLYTDNMAVQFVPYRYNEDIVTVTLLNIVDMEDFLEMVEGSYIKWLGDKTFDTFLESYGYTDETVNRDITAAITVYQAARELDFKDPKAIAAHFYGKRLIADMTLRGVFGSLKRCRYE